MTRRLALVVVLSGGTVTFERHCACGLPLIAVDGVEAGVDGHGAR